MFQERIDHFYEVKEKFEDKIRQLQAEKKDLEANLAKVRRSYDISNV